MSPKPINAVVFAYAKDAHIKIKLIASAMCGQVQTTVVLMNASS